MQIASDLRKSTYLMALNGTLGWHGVSLEVEETGRRHVGWESHGAAMPLANRFVFKVSFYLR